MIQGRRQCLNISVLSYRGNPIRDWLNCGHVALDKCNVSPGATSKQLLPSRKQNRGFELASL